MKYKSVFIFIMIFLVFFIPVNAFAEDRDYGEEHLKDIIAKIIENREPSIILDLKHKGKGAMSYAGKLLSDVFMDKPYLEAFVKKYAWILRSVDGVVEIEFTYRMTDEEYQAVINKINGLIEKNFNSSTTDLEKVKFFHDYLVLQGKYGMENKNGVDPYSPYSIIVEDTNSVCQAYASFMYLALTQAGVENIYVVGKANGGLHAWNMVKINNKWYHLDVTWDDPVPDRKGVVSYKYFLVSDAKIESNRIWDKSKTPLAVSNDFQELNKITKGIPLGNYIYYYDYGLRRYKLVY